MRVKQDHLSDAESNSAVASMSSQRVLSLIESQKRGAAESLDGCRTGQQDERQHDGVFDRSGGVFVSDEFP